MPNFQLRHFLIGAALLAVPGIASAQDVQSGVTAWQAGDYERAVTTWRPLADRGDADAQFNLGQAYRLGRGVPQNLVLAEQWFERAARQRHDQAGASLGLLLFQNGRAREAMPWLQAAATKGDPRAQYVFGTALFNGDVVRRDLPRAYAMMRAAAAQGFPQAQAQLGEMERQLSPEDRSRGAALAAELANSAPRTEVAAADPPPLPQPRRAETPAPRGPQGRPGVSYEHPPEDGRPAAPPQREVEAQPSRRPSNGAGVSYEHPPEDGRPVTPRREARPEPTRRRPAPVRAEPARPRPAPAATPSSPARGGSWRVQLGAFRSEANAQRQWAQLRRRVAALGPLQPSYQRAGAITRLRTQPVGSRAAADRVCAAVRAAGEACIAIP